MRRRQFDDPSSTRLTGHQQARQEHAAGVLFCARSAGLPGKKKRRPAWMGGRRDVWRQGRRGSGLGRRAAGGGFFAAAVTASGAVGLLGGAGGEHQGGRDQGKGKKACHYESRLSAWTRTFLLAVMHRSRRRGRGSLGGAGDQGGDGGHGEQGEDDVFHRLLLFLCLLLDSRNRMPMRRESTGNLIFCNASNADVLRTFRKSEKAYRARLRSPVKGARVRSSSVARAARRRSSSGRWAALAARFASSSGSSLRS